MSRRGAFDPKGEREKLRGTGARSDGIVDLIGVDPAKALVVTYFQQLVADGFAEWHIGESGDVQLCLRSGQIFLLEEQVITRIA